MRAVLVFSTLCALSCARTRPTEPSVDGGIHWQPATLVVSGPAIRGPWRQNESEYRWVDDVTVDLNATGDAAVAWVDQAQKDLFFQRYDPTGRALLGRARNVSRSPSTFSWLPRVVYEAQRIDVLWQEIVFSGGSHGGEIFFARSNDGGESFSLPLNLSNSIEGDGKGRLDKDTWDNGSLDLARSAGGDLYAAWTEYEGALWFCVRGANEEAFGAPLRLGGGHESPARGPAIAVGPTSEVHVAWALGEDPSADIQVANSTDAGRSFGASRVVERTAGHSDAPKIAVDDRGTVHVVFAESGEGRRGPYHVRYTRRLAGAERFEPSRPLSPRGTFASFPSIRVDRSGRVLVTWEVQAERDERPRGLALTVSENRGDTFRDAAPVPQIASASLGWNGSQQGMLTEKLAMNEAGEIAIVNATFDAGRASRAFLLRGRLAR